MRDFSASGAGDSLVRLASALRTMPFLPPSCAGRSNSSVSTPALARCAAICAPMTPAPSTAALRIRRGVKVIDGSGWKVGREPSGALPAWRRAAARRAVADGGNSRCSEACRGEAHQMARGLFAVAVFADVVLALDHAEIGHRVGEGAGDDVQPPVQLLLVQMR